MSDINYALVEETRPPIYTAMKYWGKKPHNIWREYIEHYADQGGTILDPFAGSCISAFEAVKSGRKAIAFDLNPLSSFLIEALSSELDLDKFKVAVGKIVDEVQRDPVYVAAFGAICPSCQKQAWLQNAKRDSGNMYEVGIYCFSHGDGIEKSLIAPRTSDLDTATASESIVIPFWIPQDEFPNSPSFSASFIRHLGGNRFTDLWTNRNLYVISKIFSLILAEKNDVLKLQLLFGFTQTIHLCTKMSVPRRANAARPFSTSWGRSAYVCSARQMEMNPLLVFEGSCLGKQSVESSIRGVKDYLGKVPKILYTDRSNRKSPAKNFDIKYGIIDVANLNDFVPPGSVDFVITDPPYGGLVQYLDLSLIWLVWLAKWDPRFKPNLEAEITIKKGIQDIELYKKKFTKALSNIYSALSPNGKLVLTFHNSDLEIWNAFLNSVVLSGFRIEKVIHQQNRRTGESNVGNPYGTSASDFYIRCVKQQSLGIKTDKSEFEHYVVTKAIQLIASRNEPTPYQILFNGLLVEISSAGFDLQDFDKNIEKILSHHLDEIFVLVEDGDKSAGKLWWLGNPESHIRYPDRQLSDRVEETIISLLRRKISISFDDALAEIFIAYPNGLTPTVVSITKILARYATQSNDKWVYKGGDIEQEFTKHTEVLATLSDIGKKLGFEIFIGKREQPEPIHGRRLAEFADHTNLQFLRDDKLVRARLEMIDMLWIKNDSVVYALEVENSTNFTSGVQRASNLSSSIPKLMILPDYRLAEFARLRDRLFVENFVHYSWKYLTYTDVERLAELKKPHLADLDSYSRKIEV